MTKQDKIPDEQTRQRSVKNLREVRRQLELFGLELDELLAMANIELRRQRRQRLEGKYKRSM